MTTISSLQNEAAPETAANSKTILSMLAGFADLATLLRMSGALTVVAAMSAFLLQGWHGGNDLHRYYLLLSQTLLLCAGGFGLSYGLKENKGARVFFALSLLSVTANLVTLGALVFSLVQWGGNLAHYPAFASWKAAGMGDTLLAMGVAVAVLAPVAYFGFLVFARRSARALSLLFLFTNLLLLIPVRESWMVGAVALSGVLIPFFFAGRLLRQDATLRTPEGYFAVAALFAPALIIITRSMWLYQVDAALQLMLASGAFLLLRGLATGMENTRGVKSVIGALSIAAAFAATHPLAALLTGSNQGFYTLFAALFMALGLDIARHHEGRYAKTTCIIAGTSCLIPFMDTGTTASALVFILAGVIVCMAGRRFAKRFLLLQGAFMILAGIADQLHRIIAWVDFSNWATLAILGATAIILASVIERHGAIIKLKWQQYSKR
jgi:hypothetical protein